MAQYQVSTRSAIFIFNAMPRDIGDETQCHFKWGHSTYKTFTEVRAFADFSRGTSAPNNNKVKIIKKLCTQNVFLCTSIPLVSMKTMKILLLQLLSGPNISYQGKVQHVIQRQVTQTQNHFIKNTASSQTLKIYW